MERQVTPLIYIAEAGIGHDTPLWYVAYTYPRHEKAVSEQLQLRLVETFLPTYKHTSTWKDRRVKLDLPLFAGYVFTRVPERDRLKVISVPGVIRMLSYRGAPVAVSDAEIDAIRRCVGSGAKLEPHRYITVGDRVRVREGVFEGLNGIIVRENNQCKLVISIELIHQSVSLEIDPNCLELVNPANMRGRIAMHESNTRRGCAGVMR
jgi:transcription antitermination factor NusG